MLKQVHGEIRVDCAECGNEVVLERADCSLCFVSSVVAGRDVLNSDAGVMVKAVLFQGSETRCPYVRMVR